MLTTLAATALLALAPLAAAADDDRPPTDEERAQIEDALRAAGFTRWDEIELDDGLWEVDDAVHADGGEYDVYLDADYAIVRQDPD